MIGQINPLAQFLLCWELCFDDLIEELPIPQAELENHLNYQSDLQVLSKFQRHCQLQNPVLTGYHNVSSVEHSLVTITACKDCVNLVSEGKTWTETHPLALS